MEKEKLIIENKENEIPLKMYEISGLGAPNLEKYLQSKKQDDLIKKTFELKPELKHKETEKDYLGNLSEKEISQFIEKTLNEDDLIKQKIAVGFIKFAPIEDRQKLIEKALEKDVKIQEEAIIAIGSLKEEEIFELAKKALAKSPEIQARATALILYLPSDKNKKIKSLIYKKIEENLKKDIKTIKKTYLMFWLLPEKEKLEKTSLLIEKIKDFFNSGNLEEQKEAIEMIRIFPEKEITKFIIKSLEKDIEVQKEAIKLLKYAPKTDRDYLIKKFFEEGLGEELIKPSLYDKNKNINNSVFKREEFEKTGSETTLIGGALKDKLIIRKINFESFIAWQKAYEDYNLWEKNGFDYVPIEPIQSYNLDKEGLINVYSGILDLSLDKWNKISNKMFGDELEEKKEKILQILQEAKILHEHPHCGNFCLRFFRDKDGKPDVNKVPRLYLIDFDKASS